MLSGKYSGCGYKDQVRPKPDQLDHLLQPWQQTLVLSFFLVHILVCELSLLTSENDLLTRTQV